MRKKAIIIGSGFAGLSAACFMAKKGWHVQVLEKHSIPGGRARQLKAGGFTFDMGPSWYWMPDVFERFFNQFDKTVSNYYSLHRLDPSYRIYFKDEAIDIPANYDALKSLFEQLEPGSGKMLDTFMHEAAYKYQIGMHKLVYKPGLSVKEFWDIDLIKGVFKLDVFNSLKSHVAKHFKNSKLRELMEFPVLFLGALPQHIPALYSLMNYADIKGGTWYPQGGMYSIVEAMCSLAAELGVQVLFNENVTAINIDNGTATSVSTTGKTYEADVVISAADYHFTEMQLLPKAYRSYSEKYWSSRVMAPGSLLYYVGLNKKLQNITHHSLFFDASFEEHGKAIYKTKEWAKDPLFYVSATSVTDNAVAPAGCENLFLLIPEAAGLTGDTEELRNYYFNNILQRLEKHLQQDVRSNIIFKQSFAHSNFINDYNAFKGNAYGLANTLMQTAILKPKCKSRKVHNLFYAGQLTVPGPGVPPSIISGEIVAGVINQLF
ncbi:phytoene desaturase [Ilyomonas limi]|uniref:Phytoene desaturase n=1 Tax=Ilyomonas limi TaxID=2575867 RepID=A0A4U3KPX7_9BACT|nr:oleate hydratase [Ilyomonas limi]TKK64242.1 phytoene desaturase [Ilyomonas limi]